MPDARLPLFPLPLVLFPGATLPLHIFEPRYRTLLADCQRGDGRFGIVLAPTGGGRPTPGTVGCIAELREVRRLADGRANVLVAGAERFAIARLVDDDAPYAMAEVSAWSDAPDDDDAIASQRVLVARVRDAFRRVAAAARAIADEDVDAPTLPDDPAALSFAIAAAIEFELSTRQRLLTSRSSVERLRTLESLLATALPEVEERAAVHRGARSNGHGPHGPSAATP